MVTGDGAKAVILIPPGTYLYEPDDIHRVTLQFPTQNDAIVFFEILRSLCLCDSVTKN